MNDSNEWELSKENVQPLRQGRKVASLTSALQHTPMDLQQIKDQRNVFEQELRMYDGEDPLEIWDSYIKWTEQHFPRGGKDGNLMELVQRCLTHFKDHDGYKDDQRFVQIWIKFANFIDDPLQIYTYMFDQKIGCALTLLYEEWANFLERLGNTKKADTIYLEGISRGAQPLDVLRAKHSEFQMRVARGITLQSQEEVEAAEEEQRMVLGGLRADKKNRVGTTRTGSAKLGHARPLGAANPVPQKQQPSTGFRVFQDENTPATSAPQQTGEYRSVPVRSQVNRENEQAPGVWTKARAQQRKAVAAAAAVPSQPAFSVHEDENIQQPHASGPMVDSHVLSARKAEKPGHMLEPFRKVASNDERPMYCKEKVYCGTQEFSFEELRGLRYMEKKRKKEQEEEQQRLGQQLNEMRLMQEQVKKDLESMQAEKRQLLALQRQMHNNVNPSSRESTDVQPSPAPMGSAGASLLAQDTPSFSRGQPFSNPPSASFSSQPPSNSFSSQPPSNSFSSQPPSNSFSNQPPSNSFSSQPPSNSFSSTNIPSAPSSASFNTAGPPSAPSSASFNSAAVPFGSGSSANSSLRRQPREGGTVLMGTSLNSSQRTPVFNTTGGGSVPPGSAGSGSGHRQPPRSRPAAPTPEGNTSKHQSPSLPPCVQSLTSASPTINMKEALQMVQGMYNVTLDCDKMAPWEHEDTEMTEAVQAPAASAPIVVFDETRQKSAQPQPVAIFCDESSSDKENSKAAGNGERKPSGKGLAFSARKPILQEKPTLQEKPVVYSAPLEFPAETVSEDYLMGEGTDFYPHYDVTLAAVGSQDSFVAAAHAASTPFGLKGAAVQLPSLPLSSIKPVQVARQLSDDEMTGDKTGADSSAQQSQNPQFHTFNTTRVTPSKNDLSPINEGSSESSEESKSHAASILERMFIHLGHAHGFSPIIEGSSESSEESKSHAASILGCVSGASTLAKTPAAPTRRNLHLSSADVEMAAASGGHHHPPMTSEPPSDHQHVIDTSCYVPAEPDEKTEALLSMSVCVVDAHNPFDEGTVGNFLKKVSPPLEQRPGYMFCNQHVPNFGCQFVNLGEDTYQLQSLIGEGGYAKVYRALNFSSGLDDSSDTMDIESTGSICVIKVQKPASAWEFYICSEIHQRLQKLGLSEMSGDMMRITHGYFYTDGSCLLSECCQQGSLLTLMNRIKDRRELMAGLEPLAAFLTVHLLRMVESLHRCRIVHGDIKPDNILITGCPQPGGDREAMFGPHSQCLRLVDFGQAIDMSLYPPATTFTAKVATDGFQCVEMMTDRPWTYQTDMFGLLGSVHVLVFGQYMKVYCSQGKWHMTSNFQRKWKVELWKKLFHQLLNIPDCDHQPDLGALRREFEDHFMTSLAPHLYSVVAKVLG